VLAKIEVLGAVVAVIVSYGYLKHHQSNKQTKPNRGVSLHKKLKGESKHSQFVESDRDHMVVGFTTTYAISAYHH
jgi:hypothetical protein